MYDKKEEPTADACGGMKDIVSDGGNGTIIQSSGLAGVGDDINSGSVAEIISTYQIHTPGYYR